MKQRKCCNCGVELNRSRTKQITSSRNVSQLRVQVFAPEANGRSYRLRPKLRSVWLRQVTLHGGPFGLFLVRDTSEIRAAAAAAGALVDEPSRQSTNSWGLRTGSTRSVSTRCISRAREQI